MLCTTALAYPQIAQEMAAERHHTMVFEDSKVRIFGVTLPRTEQAFIRHDHNYAMVTLNDCELVIWSAGQSDILNFRLDAGDMRFIFGGAALGLRNDRSQECRLMVVEFLDPKVTSYGYQPSSGGWDYGANAVSPAVDPHAKYESTLSLEGVRLKHVQLLAGDDLPQPSEKADEVLIALTDVDLSLGATKVRKSVGEVVALARREKKLINVNNEPARFAILEFH
jgi:hypothetical protein